VTTSAPLVSIIILNYNGIALLDDCLKSVFATDYRPLEVLLVDNGSTDGSVAFVRSRFPEVRLLALTRNLGFAGGNNRGVESATGDYVVLLNNDTRVEPGWVKALLMFLEDPGVAIVTSRVVTEGVPDRYYTKNGSLNYLGYNIMRVFNDLSLVFFAGGASLMFRRQIVGKPFLDEYFLYHEDVYLSWRMRLAGYKIRMAQDSSVFHLGSVTASRQASSLVTFYQERNRLLNCFLLYEISTLFRLLPLFVADGVVKLALSVVAGRKSPLGIVRAYVWCLTHARWILNQRRVHQAVRTVSDREILSWMSPRLLDHEGSLASAMNALAKLYARLMRLPFYA
jgi:GT2 family glycosyltransferase